MGVAHVFGEQRIDRLGSDADDVLRGGFELNGAGATLVLDSDAQGTNRTWTVWDGTIRGDGGVVKEGARSELVLTGMGDYRGPTEIEAGTVRLRGTGSDLVAHWTFTTWFRADAEASISNNTALVYWRPSASGGKAFIVDTSNDGRALRFVTLATNGVGTTQSVVAYVTGDAFRQGNDRQRLHHLAAVQDNTARTFTLYIDGREVGSAQIPQGMVTASTAENFWTFKPVLTGCWRECVVW